MKILKNNCFGGYSLSPKAIKRVAELKGKECFFFEGGLFEDYTPITIEEAEKDVFFSAFSIPNPNEVIRVHKGEEVVEFNNIYDKYCLDSRPDRTDPDVIKAVEELGTKVASGRMASLEIVEIPDGIEYEIDEYDGSETIREKHRTW